MSIFLHATAWYARSQERKAQALGVFQMWWYFYESTIFWRAWSWFQKMELQLCWASICVHLCQAGVVMPSRQGMIKCNFPCCHFFVWGDDPRKVCMDLWLNPPVCFHFFHCGVRVRCPGGWPRLLVFLYFTKLWSNLSFDMYTSTLYF